LKTGLFSTIVTTFIAVLSLPRLSADSGGQTVALLTQLVNISTGAPVVVQNTPFEAPASIVRVNVMWLLSLILSLSSALLAAMTRQWARRYLNYAHHDGTPRKRARIRAYMFEGVEEFRLSQTVEAIPLLLHASFFLFFAGLIDFLLPINKVVAFSTLGCVAVFTFIYAILTLLPNWRLNCPYYTPLSGFTYFSFQFSAFNLFSTVKAIEGIFHGLLLAIWPEPRSPGPTEWRAMLEDKVHTHYKRFSHGLRWSVVSGAMKAPSGVDESALHWTLTTLDKDKELEDFSARMPGFFNSRAAPNATSAMLSLMEKPASDPILGSRLRELLGTCLPGASLLTEEQRNHRLRGCLKSLWYCLRAYNLPENSEVPLAPYVRAIFASPDVIGWIRTEQDPAARLLGRCFGSLVVKKLANGINSPTHRNIVTDYKKHLACLSYILDATDEQVKHWLKRKGAIDLANVISLASGEFGTLVASWAEGDVGDVFQQTLSILTEGIVSGSAHVEWDPDDLLDQVAQFHHMYSEVANARAPDVLKERLRYISDRLPRSSYLAEVTMKIPSPELDPETAPSPSMSHVQIGGEPNSDFVDGGSSTPTRD
jgi:hypothetical protein